MTELVSYGSERGAVGNDRPYREKVMMFRMPTLFSMRKATQGGALARALV